MKHIITLNLTDQDELVLADAVSRGVNDASSLEELLKIGALQRLNSLSIDFEILQSQKRESAFKQMPVEHAGTLAEIALLVSTIPAESKDAVTAKLVAFKSELSK